MYSTGHNGPVAGLLIMVIKFEPHKIVENYESRFLGRKTEPFPKDVTSLTSSLERDLERKDERLTDGVLKFKSPEKLSIVRHFHCSNCFLNCRLRWNMHSAAREVDTFKTHVQYKWNKIIAETHEKSNILFCNLKRFHALSFSVSILCLSVCLSVLCLLLWLPTSTIRLDLEREPAAEFLPERHCQPKTSDDAVFHAKQQNETTTD